MKFQIKLLSSLDKVFQDEEPFPLPGLPLPCGFQNESFAFQAAYCMTQEDTWVDLRVEIDSPIASCIHVRQVRQVPVSFAIYDDHDADYLRTGPGLYPDLLSEVQLASLYAFPGRWGSVWIDVKPDEHILPGIYPVQVRFIKEAGGKRENEPCGQVLAEAVQQVEILPGSLPPQRLMHTKWFYCDALANYYHVPAFSEEHWRIIEHFVRKAVEGGINMILMPVHTQPINTWVGGERLTTQLVRITVEDGEYRFDMTNVRRWIAMCKRCGVEYHEIAHFFTQWGSRHAPKIIAEVDGREQRIFGWETDSLSDEYRAFLEAYLPALDAVFAQEGIRDKVVWHISDEPSEAHLPYYLAAKELVQRVLPHAVIIDALEDVQFYTSGVVEHPVAPVHTADDFVQAGVKDLWLYYSCDDYIDVCNHFIAMPSARCRAFALQLFKYNIAGFLHWGYNFYNTARSQYVIDPYASTDADGRYPAGDAFQVYPGADGQPEESIRMAVFSHCMQDLRAMEWLASLTSREYVVALLEAELPQPITFHQYPRCQQTLLALRHKINQEIIRIQGGTTA